jgi:predicted enzyme related to lactoylglutathione lyase
MANTINWFEIPVLDFERAKNFYGDILEVKIEKTEMGGDLMGFLPVQNRGDVSGAIVFGNNYVPSDKGVLIYLNGGEDLNGILSRVEKAGGKIVVPKTLITEDIGYFAIFFDTEGNKIALHSGK